MKNKLFFLLILLLAVAATVSCAEPEDLIIKGDENIFTDFEGVYLTLDSIGESSIAVVWHNETEHEITFGEGYSVEMLSEDGAWTSVQSVQKEEMSVPAIALGLPTGGEIKKGYSFKPFDLSKIGKYRLRCEFYPGEGICNTWVEFEVTQKAEGNVNRIPDSDLSGFSEFLDSEGFVKGMSQGQLMDLADKYSEELDPSIVPMFLHYDGTHGGGCTASGEFFGYTNDYYADDDTGKVRYTNMIYTSVKIKALKLPYNIKYGDGIGEVLEKIGIDRDIYKNTAAYEDTKLTLCDNGTTSLVLVNNFLTDVPVDFLYDYELILTEKIGTLTRTVKLSFSDSKKDLARIEIKTVDEYKK